MPQREPACDLDAERAVLACVLLDSASMRRVAHVEPTDFYAASSAATWSAMLRLYRRGGAIDLVTVRAELVRMGDLERAGGDEAIVRLTEAIPIVDHVETYARSVTQAATQRRLREAGLAIASEADGPPVDDPDRLLGGALSRLRLVVRNDQSDPFAGWQPVGQRDGWLTDRPPARRWLLRRDGAGALARGIVGLFVAPGGHGKTMSLIDLAVCVATGRPWFGEYRPEGPGRVVLALAEETDDEIRRRLYNAVEAADLTPYERGLVERNVVALGLSGRLVGLVSAETAGAPVTPTDVHRMLLERLADQEHALVVLDPLSRWVPDVESSNAQATAAVQALEMIAAGPGRPTVLVAHHTPKASRKEGNELGHEMVRGVTGLTDAVRWVGALGGRGDGLHFGVIKSNYSAHGDPIQLVRGAGGVLRPPTEAELKAKATAKERKKAADSEAKREELRDAVLAAIEASPGIGSKALKKEVTGRDKAITAAVASLIEAGLVEDRGGTNGRELHACVPPEEDAGRGGPGVAGPLRATPGNRGEGWPTPGGTQRVTPGGHPGPPPPGPRDTSAGWPGDGPPLDLPWHDEGDAA